MTRPSASLSSASRLVREGERPREIVAFEKRVVAYFVDAADFLGVPKSVSAIYGIVFASPTPLCFADIEERLDVSKGSISQGLRILREVGALKEVSKEDDRVERFEPDLELRKLVLRFLEHRLQRQLDVGANHLGELMGTLPHEFPADVLILRRRLNSLNDWQKKAGKLLPVAKTFLKLGG